MDFLGAITGAIGGALGGGGGGSSSAAPPPPTAKATTDEYGNVLTVVKSTTGSQIVLGSSANPLGSPMFLIAIAAGLVGFAGVVFAIRKAAH